MTREANSRKYSYEMPHHSWQSEDSLTGSRSLRHVNVIHILHT